MLGMELPPYNSGGLGTACLGLTEHLANRGVAVNFLVPKIHGAFPYNHMQVTSAADYQPPARIRQMLQVSPQELMQLENGTAYGNQHQQAVQHLLETNEALSPAFTSVSPQLQATWYGYQAAAVAQEQHYSVIHSHDWMTLYAGLAAKKQQQRMGNSTPFIAHVHATELDRGGAHGHPEILKIEQKGLQAADQIITVSNYTKEIVHKHYDIARDKISVVHNGVTAPSKKKYNLRALKNRYKLVLFMGRLTSMKGPEYFLELAERVTSADPKVRFIMVGSGDMEARCSELAAEKGLTGKIIFSNFLRGEDVNKAYQLADVFVVPSTSEPFGLVALEAMQNGTPVIISKNAGVVEVSKYLIPVDFWDTARMESIIKELLYDTKAAARLSRAGKHEVQSLTWDRAASQVHSLYKNLLVPNHLLLSPSL